jgi:ribosome biogenesis protein ENP2
MQFDKDGLTLGVGTSTGHVLLYDMRSSTPKLIKDHQYGFGIKNINFHASGNVISCDQKIMKVWDKNKVCLALLLEYIIR